MRDRAMQALYRLSLDPLAETLADPNSYGFRTHRAPADAIPIHIAIAAPAAANALDIAAPMPREPPVTSAVRPRKPLLILLSPLPVSSAP